MCKYQELDFLDVDITFQKQVLYRSMDSKLNMSLPFAEGTALEITQKFASRKVALYRMFLIIPITAYIILLCKLECQYARKALWFTTYRQ